MHVRGARRTGLAAGVHGRRAGRVGRRAGRTGSRRYAASARGRVGVLVCAATSVLFTREHILHLKSPK
ncbi:hypothetical protein CRG98_041710 [Punica granatum]|uniref:Uncharacterized protein n=1 Tax=Punica granatum TaxID=22663 RepID=A0A2I0I377_PUNGR|nr:hypothetical protein CRG98_041710 [Punica granatum]